MDAIQNFDDSGFKVLKKVRKSNPLSKYATHKLQLQDIESQDNEFHSLLNSIKSRIKNGKLEFGYPLGIEYAGRDNIHKINADEGLIEFIGTSDDDILSEHSTNMNNPPKLLKIGQGLSFIDEENKFIYDAGGSVGYSKFHSMIDTSMKYSVVLSHPHYDHYKYIAKMIDDALVEQIFMNTTWYGGKRFKELISKASTKGIKISSPSSFKGYSFFYFPKNNDVNKMSTLCSSPT